MTETIDPALITARLITYGLAILLFGAAAFEAYAPQETHRRREMPSPAPLLLAASALGYAILLAREASAEPGWPSLGLMADIYATTGFGRALAVTLAAALGLSLTALSPLRLGRLSLALSGVALAALAFVGHAADDVGVKGAARLATMALHLLAVGAWLGALPPLWRALGRAATAPLPLLRRFGLIGGVCVALVVLTGLGSLAFMFADAKGRLGADYRRVLLVKLGFVLALFALAALNRFRLTPLFARDPERARRAMRLTIVLEQLAGLGAIASVAWLGQLDPGM